MPGWLACQYHPPAIVPVGNAGIKQFGAIRSSGAITRIEDFRFSFN
jgi:hypothetical protein